MARKSKPYKSSLQHGVGGERKGLVNFRIHWDDKQLMSALKDLQEEGQDELRKLINRMMLKAKKESEKLLYKQQISARGTKGGAAGGHINSSTPSGDKSAYVRIAKSLKITDDALFVRLYSAPYPSGYLSQGGKSRGGYKIAMLHAAGSGPFNYSKNTPTLIKSSLYWFLKTGKPRGFTKIPVKKNIDPNGDASFPPRSGNIQDKQHPGFKKVDFIGTAQEYMEDNWDREAEEFIKDYLRKKGFSDS